MKPAVTKPLNFGSAFSDIFTEYIELNRSVGKKYNCDADCLEKFDQWCQKEGVTRKSLTRNVYEQWCGKRANESDATQRIRIDAVNRAVIHLRNNGYCDFIPSPAPRTYRSYVPYIYTKDELHKFFTTANNMKPQAIAPLAYSVFPLMFKMIYCCGLRKSEAINLRVNDVDLKQGILTVLNAKHNKDRLIPMSESLTKLCRDYSDKILPPNSTYFFPAPDGNRLSGNTVYCRFRELLWKSDISHGGRGKGPRIHDFRHSFAVHRLAEWTKSGVDIYTTIPILSVYLGHYDLAATQYYLRLTAEVFPEMTAMFENHFVNVFQEVKFEKS
jgi:integrase